VLNFGLPALSGQAASSLDVSDLAKAIREAIITFEPRILPSTLQIKTLLESGQLDHHNVVGVEIRAHLWAQPVPLEFLVRTEIDLETGNVQITDLNSPRVA
jgi:type VI secretion system protein ImpF